MVSAVKNIAKSETVEKKQVGKRYQIIRPLSTGGMSQTYLAEDMQRPNQPICVVKQLKASTDTEEELKNIQHLFEREAETLERLGDHNQIPRLLAYFEENGSFYLVQEFIEGHPLTHEMPLGEWWSETQVIKLLKELLAVLAFVHSQNVIHLDLKPANIIRRQHDNKLVLIDFGAVKRVNLPPIMHQELGKTQSTVLTCVGTKGYMAIEQMMGKPNLSSDIHALGMTAIQALTGILPLQLRDDENGEVAWTNQAEVSDALAEVLTKMVRRYHKQRYQSIAEVTAALDSVEMAAVIQSALPLKIGSVESFNQAFTARSPHTVQSKSNPTVSESSDPFSFGQSSQFSQNYGGASAIPTINSPIGSADTENESLPDSDSEASQDTPIKEKLSKTPFFQQKGWLRKVGIGAFIASVMLSGSYVGYRQWQRSNDKTALAEISVLVQQEKAEDCIAQAIAFPERAGTLHQQAIESLETCSQQVLEIAKLSAEQYSFVSAIEKVGTIPPKAPIAYEEAQELILKWPAKVVENAEKQYGMGKANDAIAMLKAVPKGSHMYEEAQEKITRWQAEWTANESLVSEAKALVGNDGNLAESESYRSENKVQSALESLAAGKALTQAAQAKIDALKVLGEPIAINENMINSLEGLKEVTELMAWRVKEAKELDYWIDIKEKTPLEILKGDLSEGVLKVEELKKGVAKKNVLARDYVLWGNEGDRWNISMESDDFSTVVHLIYPKESDTDNEPQVLSGHSSGRRFNSSLSSIRLPRDGYYKVRASAYYSASGDSHSGTGNYQLFVTNSK